MPSGARQFMAQGAHFESEYALLFLYTPPLRRSTPDSGSICGTTARPAPGSRRPTRRWPLSASTLEDVEDALGDAVTLRRMTGYTVTDGHGRCHLRDELVNYLHFS